MRVVISLGGSVLAPDLDSSRVAGYAAVLESLADAGCEIGVVVGGGGVARDYITAARALDANEVELDQLGIDVTRLNARLLGTALGEDANAVRTDEYDAAGAALRRGDIALMGGMTPGQTTDAVAAILAESVDADLLVYATSADGVYDADPATDPDATKFASLSPAELVDIVVPMSRDAGASAPVDILAAKLIDRSAMRSVVLDGTDPKTVEAAVRRGEHSGTDIVPETSDDPVEWIHAE